MKGEGQKEGIFLKKIHFFITTLVHFNNFYYLCNVLARLAKIIPIFFRFFTQILLYAIRHAETRAYDARTIERDCC